MIMEEDHHDELMRFVCKYCDKKYPSGKSLGGHMRSHVIAAAAAANAANFSESDEKYAALMINGNGIVDGGGGGNGIGNSSSSSYGLRENPKKTWRATVGINPSSNSTFSFPNERVCKQCGKGFQSLKALCGHMACHSDKDRGLKDYDHSWTSENLDDDDGDGEDDDDDDDDKVVTDSQSDNTDENENFDDPSRVTRSKSKRYNIKKLVVKPFSFSNNSYNSVSEVDEIEKLEEVALCLMMLSKDSANWAGVDFVVESSDNNSAVLETKSPSTDAKTGKKLTVLDALENPSSGARKHRIFESDVSVEELLRNGDRNRNKPKGGREFSYEEKLEIRRNLFREFGYRDPFKKRARDADDSYNPELEREASNKKKNKYECLTCNKIFSSFQGLGGHRPCHKKNNLFASTKHENGAERDYGPTQNPKYDKKIRVKKSKGHECPTCFRMFKSGQALGGHRRSHFINGTIGHIAATGNEVATCSDMIDLNLPAPEEE